MKVSFNSNLINQLQCTIDNKLEDLSRIQWLIGKRKKIECKICGETLDSIKDVYSPRQYGWKCIDKYTWICHSCLCHRNFKPYIKKIDDNEHKEWEEYRNKTKKKEED